MKKLLSALILCSVSLFIIFAIFQFKLTSGAPPYYVVEPPTPAEERDELAYLKDWKRPEGPARVGLQVGHWQNDEMPEELHRLVGNTGASAIGIDEWEVNYEIASQTAQILEKEGVIVDILPAAIPVDYWADAFIAIHADGSLDYSKSGFKLASPRRDYSGKASKLLDFIKTSYGQSTNLPEDPNVTRNMRGYYAFSWWRFDHAVHPMTAATILETGFLSSPEDRKIIVNQSELSAEGLANGILEFLKSEKLL